MHVFRNIAVNIMLHNDEIKIQYFGSFVLQIYFQLAAPIVFNARQSAIRLPTSDVVRNEGITVVAWGSTGFRQRVHDNLQKLNARCMLWDECQRYHQNFMRIHPNEFCTLITTGTGTCNVIIFL